MRKTEASVDPPQNELFDTHSEVLGYERSPLDVLRLLGFAAGTLMLALLTKYLREGIDGLEENITSVLEVPWSWAQLTVDVLLIVVVVVAGLAALVVPLITKRFRLFGYVLIANVATTMLLGALVGWVGLSGTSGVTDASAEAAARGVAADVVGAAHLVAAFVTISPFVGRKWRRAGGWTVLAMVLMRLLVASGTSTHVGLVLLGGATIGSAVLLAFGRPTTQPRLASIIAALRSSGIPVSEMHPASVDARGSVPYFATLDDDSRVFAKVLGEDQRAADLLFRTYRAIHLRNVGDERPFSSLRRTVEHEALVALQARDVGVRTPRLRCVAPVGQDSFLLCYDMIDGGSLDGVDEVALTDDVLRGLWEQVGVLRQYRIAHRDLRLANVFLSDDAKPWLIDFGFSEIAASETLLRADVAQLIAALSVAVGAERAVAPAIEVLGPDAVSSCLGRLQPAALSGATQTDLKARKDLLDQVRSEIEQRCEAEEPELEPVTRFGPKQIFTLVMLAAVFYFLIPQFADLPGIVTQIKDANWNWLLPILVASAGTYLAATMSTLGAVPSRLPVGPTAAAQVGASFASKVAPAGLGGMAMNVRYMQRQGIDTTVATSSVGLNAGAGVIVHIALAGLFVVWAGRDAFGSIELPSPRALGCPWRRGARGRPCHARAVDPQARGEEALPHPGQGGAGSERRAHDSEQGRALVGRLCPADAELRGRVQLLGAGVRRRPSFRLDRRGLPGRIRDRHGRADAGWSGCCRGGTDRRAHRGRRRQGGRSSGGVPVPPGHVLDPHLAGLPRVLLVAQDRTSLTASSAVRRAAPPRRSIEMPSE